MNPLIKLYLKTFRLRYFFNSLSYYVFYNKNNLEYLRNSYRGKPLLIVGNGPSLNKTPLDNFIDRFKSIPSELIFFGQTKYNDSGAIRVKQ